MFKALFTLLFISGMREGELLGLFIKDIDFEKNEVHIYKNYYRENGKDYFTTPKTKSSNRVVVIDERTSNLLKQYLKTMISNSPTNRLFPISKSSLYNKKKWACQRSGVREIRVHDLRHSNITYLLQNGYDAKDVAYMVGHSNVNTTLQIYTHTNTSRQKEMANTISEGLAI